MKTENTTVIALCGAIGAGKSTAGRILNEVNGFAEMSWADPLKEWIFSVYQHLGMERRHLWGTQADKAEPIPGIVDATGKPRCGREIAEHLGTDGARWVDPNTWIKLGLHNIAQRNQEGRHVVVTDTRFPNEFEAVRAIGGEVWEVVRVGGPPEQTRDHISDRAWRSEPKEHRIAAIFGDIEGLTLQVQEGLRLRGIDW